MDIPVTLAMWGILGTLVYCWILTETDGLRQANPTKGAFATVICGPVAWFVYAVVRMPKLGTGFIRWLKR